VKIIFCIIFNARYSVCLQTAEYAGKDKTKCLNNKQKGLNLFDKAVLSVPGLHIGRKKTNLTPFKRAVGTQFITSLRDFFGGGACPFSTDIKSLRDFFWGGHVLFLTICSPKRDKKSAKHE